MKKILIIFLLISFGAQAQKRFATDHELQKVYEWLNGVRAIRGLDSVKAVTVPEIVEFNNLYAEYVAKVKFRHSRQRYEVIASGLLNFNHAAASWLSSKPHFAAITNKDVKYVVVGGFTVNNEYYVVANYYWHNPDDNSTIKEYKKEIKKLKKGRYY